MQSFSQMRSKTPKGFSFFKCNLLCYNLSITKNKYMNKKGSILAYSLIILAMMLTISLGMSMVAVTEKKNAATTNASVQAYQTADGAMQKIIAKIKAEMKAANGSTIVYISQLGSASGPGSCSVNKITGSSSPGDTYEITFYKDEFATTAGLLECGDNIDDIKNIKSVGTYKNTVRAVQVAFMGVGNCSTSDVKLLLHADTSFIDNSLSPKTVTATGATISTVQKKFGAASGVFNNITNNKDRLSVSNSADFDFGTGDFTIDGWFYPTFNNGDRIGFAWNGVQGGNSGWSLLLNPMDGLNFYPNSGTILFSDKSATAITTLNTWHHIALVRKANDWYLFVDGTKVKSVNSSIAVSSSSNPLIIGRAATFSPTNAPINTWIADNPQPAQEFMMHGYIDEFRISKAACWTSDFTPPAVAY
jgi:hypothetical protein